MKEKKLLLTGIILISAFIIWTVLIQTVDVQLVGQNGTDVGFATLNLFFYNFTGVNMTIYHITDWLGLIPIFCCMIFGAIGFIQLIKRKRTFKVDYDIILLGIYFAVILFGYLIFEMIPINYRPIQINGTTEASYPSSTTLLVSSVMPAVSFQAERRIKNTFIKKLINVFVVSFSGFMIIGRTVSGVHWLTDIIGAIILSAGLYSVYISTVLLIDKNRRN